ncbi:MAG: phosphotransferase [Selenomonadaceae bacterium]|nr:phosphotransferase [Selenomonadaceae bacterium]
MTSQVEGENLVIFFDKRVDTNNSAEVEAAINKFVAANPALNLAFDAENLEYISSIGLRILLKFRKRMKKNLVVRNVSKDVAEVFETSGFTNFFDVQKKMRRISVDGLQQIGKGTSGVVYRLDAENILKVYNDNWTLADVQLERANSQQAFLSGLDTAIAYDVVRIGENFGIVYELLNAVSLDKILIENPAEIEPYTKKFADFVKKQHQIEFDGASGLQQRIETCKKITAVDAETREIMMKFLESVPERRNFSHGDLNLSNVIVQDGNFLLIDMGEISCGHPIFDISWIYFMYEIRRRILQRFNKKSYMGPTVMPEIFWQTFAQEYFNTKDAATLAHFDQEISPFALIQVLFSTTKRTLPPQAIVNYQALLKQAWAQGIIALDF